ncbi:MAG: glycosyltransferase family 9 protein [Chitinophagaceae bacterium]|nr:glycosyltransferase family 9 protein [Chitinophagaceae bacterium]
MRVSTMRSIDQWVGIPACFIISPFRWLSDLLRSAKKTKPDTRRTLFIELSEMGSAVIVDPAMRKLQTEGKAELYFAIFKKNYKSLGILQTVPESHVFKMNADNFGSLVIDIFRFMIWCRKKKISTVIDLELFSRFTALLSFFSGARSRVGFTNFHDEGLYRGNLVNRPVRYNPHVHIAINFISLVNKALGLFENPYATVPVSAGEIQLAKATVSAEATENIKNKIRQLFPEWNNESIVLINANASDMLPQRRWPQENFTEVAKQLLAAFPDIVIVATGAPAEKDYVEEVVKMTGHKKCINSAGFFSFEELVPLYSISTCMLTNDSGPAHFASVTSLKVFVLFGPETPHLYLPLGGNAEPFYLGLPCSPCVSAANHRKTTCLTRPCITGIQPATVLQRMEIFLKENESISLATISG